MSDEIVTLHPYTPVVVESPYHGTPQETERNVLYLNACLTDCYRRKETPYASHAIGTRVTNENNPEERAIGIGAGFPWRRLVRITAVYTDLGISRGMAYAIADAESLRPWYVRALQVLGWAGGHRIEYRTLPDWNDRKALLEARTKSAHEIDQAIKGL